jgi:hypothetical protein
VVASSSRPGHDQTRSTGPGRQAAASHATQQMFGRVSASSAGEATADDDDDGDTHMSVRADSAAAPGLRGARACPSSTGTGELPRKRLAAPPGLV